MTPSRRRGLSLTEVLVALAILFIAIGLLLPPIRSVREPAARATCTNNLKQVMLAVSNYHSNHNRFPPGCVGPGATPEDRLSWMVAVLPHLEQEGLFRTFDLKQEYAANRPASQVYVKTFLCPVGVTPESVGHPTHYIAMAGVGLDAASRPKDAAGNGFMGYDRPTTMFFPDGISTTIALMETRSGIGPWARGGTSNLRGFDPADLPLHGNDRPFGGHPTVMLAGMADGAVRSIPATIDPAHLAARITIAGGEVVE